MRHFPVFVDLQGQRVVVSGAGDVAVAKLRLILKTEADVVVFGADPHPDVTGWAAEGRLQLFARPIGDGDALGARLLYAANGNTGEDTRAAAIGRAAGALTNIVDNLEDSQFITPAIVDRDPVTVAIGTEGAAPVLARRIKADIEERLHPATGTLAQIGRGYRAAADELPSGRPRRAFWTRYFNDVGPRALIEGGPDAVHDAIAGLLANPLPGDTKQGRATIIGAGPGDPDLLTMKARRALHDADVVIYDRLTGPGILELARREATLQEVGKIPNGPSWKQADINALMVRHATHDAHVVRIKSGDPAVFGRLDEEMDALDAAAIPFEIVPGITAASAAAASIKVSLTRRNRNSSMRVLTGHDVDGFAEQDWRGMAAPGAVAAIYMGLRAARFLQGRLMIHGGVPETPVAVVENVSRPDQVTVATTIGTLPQAIADAGITGPAILFLGLTPRAAQQAAELIPEIAEVGAV